jgi:uncharacterized membrane protein YccF (DUF307 family)
MVTLLRFITWICFRLWLGMFLWGMGAVMYLTVIGAPLGAAMQANSYKLMRL